MSPPTAGGDGLSVRLRRALRPAHDRIEALPFSRAVAQGQIPADAFATYLDGLLALRAPVEAAAAMSDHPGVERVWARMTARAGDLIADLRALRREGVVSKLPARVPLAVRGDVEATARTGPAGLVGFQYAAAGVWHGLRMVERAARRQGEVHLDGLRILGQSGPRFADGWRGVVEALDGALEPGEEAQALAAAQRAFVHMVRALAAATPEPRPRLTRLRGTGALTAPLREGREESTDPERPAPQRPAL